MAWTYRGGCKSFDFDCCYWSGETEEEFFDTEELAKEEANRRFPFDHTAFWHEVFEVKDSTP